MNEIIQTFEKIHSNHWKNSLKPLNEFIQTFEQFHSNIWANSFKPLNEFIQTFQQFHSKFEQYGMVIKFGFRKSMWNHILARTELKTTKHAAKA